MSIIGYIAKIPLFTTAREALVWASKNRLSGYHEHNLSGQKGYMGGTTHLQATGIQSTTNAPPATTSRPQVRRTARTGRTGRTDRTDRTDRTGGGSGY
tara:strand:+ start:756 stop:1049 length:294 start_codon:yes stop_codon:yes gene_type:complete